MKDFDFKKAILTIVLVVVALYAKEMIDEKLDEADAAESWEGGWEG